MPPICTVESKIIAGSLVTFENVLSKSYRFRYRLEAQTKSFDYRYHLVCCSDRATERLQSGSYCPKVLKVVRTEVPKLPLPSPSWFLRIRKVLERRDACKPRKMMSTQGGCSSKSLGDSKLTTLQYA